MARWLKLGLFFLLAVVGTQILVRPRSGPALDGAGAPPLVLPDLDGRTLDLQSLRGRMVLVNFWATWCPPCRAEMPELAELWRAQKEGCFELLGVVEDSPRSDVIAIAGKIPYPVLTDPRGEAASAWGVMGLPSSFLVDPQGKVVRVFTGIVSRDQLLEAMRPHRPASCQGT
jgi:cytochrome c biogenesis protein CcmG/thiol:disulfide interchange protein DsbE